MGDIGDLWNDLKPEMLAESKRRRAKNRDMSLALLQQERIPVEVKNNGAHLIIRLADGARFDLWPGTGKWVKGLPSPTRDGRGVFELLKCIRKHQDAIRV